MLRKGQDHRQEEEGIKLGPCEQMVLSLFHPDKQVSLKIADAYSQRTQVFLKGSGHFPPILAEWEERGRW